MPFEFLPVSVSRSWKNFWLYIRATPLISSTLASAAVFLLMKLAVMPIASFPLSSLCLKPESLGGKKKRKLGWWNFTHKNKEDYWGKFVMLRICATSRPHKIFFSFLTTEAYLYLSHHQGQTCLLQQRWRHQTGRLQQGETEAAVWPSNLSERHQTCMCPVPQQISQ